MTTTETRRPSRGRSGLTGDITADEARRIALVAQGFGPRRDGGPARLPQVRRVVSRLQAFQLDAVNVLVRAHYLPAFSRLGRYPMPALDDLAYRRRELFEYAGHAASLLPVELHPLLRYRMALRATHLPEAGSERGRYVAAVLAEVAERGPLAAAEVANPGKRRGNWWGWSDGKAALEWLWMSGRLAVAGRRGFERLYDLPERVIPPDVLEAPTPPADEAMRDLLARAAGCLGVATGRDLADYFHVDGYIDRRPAGAARPLARQADRLVAELVEAGRLVAARVDGWLEPAYLVPGTTVPRQVAARALVSPFDSLVWERSRLARLFGFDYRIEIYVPAAKRRYGYYVLPFLLGDRLVARVDLKADRQACTLLVQSAFVEPAADPATVAGELAEELRTMASWLGLEQVSVARRGDLAEPLRTTLDGRR